MRLPCKARITEGQGSTREVYESPSQSLTQAYLFPPEDEAPQLVWWAR